MRSSIQAVMQTRTEQGAIAWAFALNTIPVVALPAWFVLGSNDVEDYGSTMRVILSGLTDSRLIHLSSFSYLAELEEAGVGFHRYQKGFLHQKVMIVDDSLSAIGSANLDNRSFRLNFEVIGIVSDTDFNREVSRMLEADLADSKPTGSDALAKQPFWFRLGVRLSRMLAPIQ